jgi:hypothetical protein
MDLTKERLLPIINKCVENLSFYDEDMFKIAPSVIPNPSYLPMNRICVYDDMSLTKVCCDVPDIKKYQYNIPYIVTKKDLIGENNYVYEQYDVDGQTIFLTFKESSKALKIERLSKLDTTVIYTNAYTFKRKTGIFNLFTDSIKQLVTYEKKYYSVVWKISFMNKEIYITEEEYNSIIGKIEKNYKKYFENKFLENLNAIEKSVK